MKLTPFSIRKRKAILTPTFFRSKGEALRSVGDAVNDPKSDLGRHAGDYILFRIGGYDATSGVLAGMPLEPVVSLSDLIVTV